MQEAKEAMHATVYVQEVPLQLGTFCLHYADTVTYVSSDYCRGYVFL